MVQFFASQCRSTNVFFKLQFIKHFHYVLCISCFVVPFYLSRKLQQNKFSGVLRVTYFKSSVNKVFSDVHETGPNRRADNCQLTEVYISVTLKNEKKQDRTVA